MYETCNCVIIMKYSELMREYGPFYYSLENKKEYLSGSLTDVEHLSLKTKNLIFKIKWENIIFFLSFIRKHIKSLWLMVI